MFIRIKKIKNKEYAYLVKNIWRKRKKASRQTTKRYLGKVHKVEKTTNVSLKDFLKINNLEKYLNENKPEKIIKNLIQTELSNHEFKEVQKDVWILNSIKLNLKEKTIINEKTKKPLCLEINNNFLCNPTLKKLLKFKPKAELTELQIGKGLANSFESAGILIPKDIFVVIAQKILKDKKNNQ